jgi:chemotaxis signal transduction protein
MRMTSPGRNSKAPKTIPLVVFSIGKRYLAARAEEVCGIWPWTHAMLVPSGTPFVNAILRHGDEVMPVFDLAARLQVQMEESSRLCLIAKRHDGPMAVCIDGEIPTLHVLAPDGIRPPTRSGPDVLGTCRVGDDEVPIYSLANLGLSPQKVASIGAASR